jgi:hypothetical protein
MPINIADQFKVNVSLPIDSRIVASGSTARGAIQFKYDGLRVFDTSDRITYIWNAITSTFSVADINGSGQINYMTRWSSSTGLTSSGIYYTVGSSINKGNVGINTSSPQAVLQINSDTGASQPFVIHKGVSTLLAYNFHSNSGDSYFDVGVGSGAIRFSDSGNIDFLIRSANTAAINSSNNANLAFQIQSGAGWAYLFKNLILSGNTTAPNLSSLFLRSQNAFSTVSTPDVAWYNDDNTGIFHPAAYQIGISLGGVQRFRFHETGLLLGGNAVGSPTIPSNKLQLDNGTGAASYIQFTAGTTTGVLSSNGFLVGVNSLGYPTFQSRTGNNSFLFAFTNGNFFHKIDRNTFTIYSSSNGESVSTVTSTGGYRTVYGTKSNFGQGNIEVGSISVPNNCYFSIEATFTAALPTTPRQFKTNKIIASYAVNSGGVISSQNTGGGSSGLSLAMISSSGANNIGTGFFDFATAGTLKFRQNFTAIGVSGHSTVAFTAVINTGVGQI